MDNFRQVFGVNPYLWPFPIFCGSGKPIGDGIYWPTVQGMKEMAEKR
jgi:palmitoyltransferase